MSFFNKNISRKIANQKLETKLLLSTIGIDLLFLFFFLVAAFSIITSRYHKLLYQSMQSSSSLVSYEFTNRLEDLVTMTNIVRSDSTVQSTLDEIYQPQEDYAVHYYSDIYSALQKHYLEYRQPYLKMAAISCPRFITYTNENIACRPDADLTKELIALAEAGVVGLFKKASNKLETMKAQYSKVEANVDKIAQNLENHQITLLKDVAMFDQMYELNLKYYKELTMYILAGKKRLAEVRSTELEALRKKAEQTGLAEDAQAYNDLVNLCNRFEKKLHDLELTRMVSVQMGPQTRLLQNNDTLMIEKIQSSLVNTIPLWKSQMVLALGMEHSRQATAAQNAVTEMTNDLLKKNADTLKMGTIATAKEAERSIIDIETLQHTNQQLISTLDEVLNIQKEGAAKRKEAEVELGKIEGELKQKLMELRS